MSTNNILWFRLQLFELCKKHSYWSHLSIPYTDQCWLTVSKLSLIKQSSTYEFYISLSFKRAFLNLFLNVLSMRTWYACLYTHVCIFYIYLCLYIFFLLMLFIFVLYLCFVYLMYVCSHVVTYVDWVFVRIVIHLVGRATSRMYLLSVFS